MITVAFRKVTGVHVATAWRGGRTENKNHPGERGERGWWPWREVDGTPEILRRQK